MSVWDGFTHGSALPQFTGSSRQRVLQPAQQCTLGIKGEAVARWLMRHLQSVLHEDCLRQLWKLLLGGGGFCETCSQLFDLACRGHAALIDLNPPAVEANTIRERVPAKVLGRRARLHISTAVAALARAKGHSRSPCHIRYIT